MAKISTYAAATPVRADSLLGSNAAGVTKNFTAASLLMVNAEYTPEDYGAIGDGNTDDTTALRNMFAAAAGKVVKFRPGATYLYAGGFNIAANTVIFGNNSTLKMLANPGTIYTTTTSQIDAGAVQGVTVTVTDASIFKVNMCVWLYFSGEVPAWDVGGSAINFSQYPHRISAINGSTLTLDTSFDAGITFPSGSVIGMTSRCLNLLDNVRLYNLKIDGNRANQTINANTWGWWVTNILIIVIGENCTVDGCELFNSQAEGITVGDHRARIVNNYIHDNGGNGIHLSGTDGTYIAYNRLYNNNLLYSAVSRELTANSGHQDGNICFSNTINYTNISDNWIEDTQRFGIGSIDENNNQHIIIRGNYFKSNALGPLEITTGGAQVLFDGNAVYASGPLTVNGASLDTPAWISVTNNYFDASTVLMDYVNHGAFVGNMVNCPLVASPIVITNCSVDFVNDHNVVVSS